jgi:hypothetical protein
LLCIASWIGSTVFVAATNDDPSDAEPILRTFALAGGVCLGVIFLAAAVRMRRQAGQVNEALYRRLALREIAPGTVRAAARRSRGIGPVYLVLAATTSALMLTAVGLGEDGPTAGLLYAGVAVVAVWVVVMVVGLGRAFKASDDLLAPLGLAITAIPSWAPTLYGGGSDLVGKVGFSGVRHGRGVSIGHRPGSAVTSIRGAFTKGKLTSAGRMATLTGEPAKSFRNVEAATGAEGVLVRRKGNGAGRYLYHDLLLAECLADAKAANGT